MVPNELLDLMTYLDVYLFTLNPVNIALHMKLKYKRSSPGVS